MQPGTVTGWTRLPGTDQPPWKNTDVENMIEYMRTTYYSIGCSAGLYGFSVNEETKLATLVSKLT